MKLKEYEVTYDFASYIIKVKAENEEEAETLADEVIAKDALGVHNDREITIEEVDENEK